jgi:hypothetical protein
MRYLSDCICEVCLLLQSNNNKNKYILNKLNEIINNNIQCCIYYKYFLKINIFYFQKKIHLCKKNKS